MPTHRRRRVEVGGPDPAPISVPVTTAEPGPRRPGSVHGFQPAQQMLGHEVGGLLLQPVSGVWDDLAHA
jgi:hypothetical protein